MRAALLLGVSFWGAGTSSADSQTVWSLSPEPLLMIGSAGGPPATTFHDVTGALSMGDSGIVIADNGSKEIRFFSREGGVVDVFGRSGDGPREFRSIEWLNRCGGDGFVVFDRIRRRLTRWTPHGELLDGFLVDGVPATSSPYSAHCGPSGDLVVVGWPNVRNHPDEAGPYRPETMLGRVDPRGSLQEALGPFPGPERFRYGRSDGPRPFGRRTIARMGEDAIYLGTGDTYEILVLENDGTAARFAGPAERTPLTSPMIAVWQDSILATHPPRRRPRIRRALERYEHPEALPAYADFMLDRTGFLWVQRYPPPGRRETTWDVFTSEGVHVSTVRMPPDFRPTEIGRDHVLGVMRDPLGIQRVALYGLSRTR